MRNLFIISLLFLAASCSRKMVPQQQASVIIKDSVVEKIITAYHSDTIHLPGDTLEIWQAIPCPQAKLDKTMHKGNTTLSASIIDGYLKINCHTDSLMQVIDSLETVTHFKEDYKNKETVVIKEVPVIKNKVPKWAWWLLGISVIYVAFKALILYYKLPIHL